MSERPVDPGRIEEHPDHDASTDELERYAHAASGRPSREFADRVMAAVELEKPPRRTFGTWVAALASGHGAANRWAQAGVLAATLVLALGGVLAAGELARLVRDGSVGSTPSPIVESVSPSPTVTPTPSPAPTISEQPSPTAEPSEPAASAAESSTAPSPTASEDHGGGSETPEPTETARASDDHSGSD